MPAYDMNNPSGANIPPQAEGGGIAAKLLGADMADKYGDVLGIRESRLGDKLRDFTVGMAAGGSPTAAEEMKMKVREAYQREYDASRQRSQQDRDQALQQIQTMQKTLTELPAMEKSLRKKYLQKTAEALGIEADPFLADVAEQPGFAEFVADPDVQASIEKDPVTALQNWTAAFGNGQVALDTFNSYSKAMEARSAKDKEVDVEAREIEDRSRRIASDTLKLKIQGAQLRQERSRAKFARKNPEAMFARRKVGNEAGGSAPSIDDMDAAETPESIREAYRSGAITREEALSKLQK